MTHQRIPHGRRGPKIARHKEEHWRAQTPPPTHTHTPKLFLEWFCDPFAIVRPHCRLGNKTHLCHSEARRAVENRIFGHHARWVAPSFSFLRPCHSYPIAWPCIYQHATVRPASGYERRGGLEQASSAASHYCGGRSRVYLLAGVCHASIPA